VRRLSATRAAAFACVKITPMKSRSPLPTERATSLTGAVTETGGIGLSPSEASASGRVEVCRDAIGLAHGLPGPGPERVLRAEVGTRAALQNVMTGNRG
jgi:hypothetical protein